MSFLFKAPLLDITSKGCRSPSFSNGNHCLSISLNTIHTTPIHLHHKMYVLWQEPLLRAPSYVYPIAHLTSLLVYCIHLNFIMSRIRYLILPRATLLLVHPLPHPQVCGQVFPPSVMMHHHRTSYSVRHTRIMLNSYFSLIPSFLIFINKFSCWVHIQNISRSHPRSTSSLPEP